MDNIDNFIDLNRIDYNDYKNHYDDLNHLTNDQLREHYNNHGKYESRVVKFNNFDYKILENTINKYLMFENISKTFVLIINLYNEVNDNRLYEYKLCIEHNLKNKLIEKIIIYYDESMGINELFINNITNNEKLEIIYCIGRPTFYNLFVLGNEHKNKNVIIANSDIIFNGELNNFDLPENNIYALTRWDFINETQCKPRLQFGKIMSSSKDTWIFKSPINLKDFENNNELKHIQIGTWNCDGTLNYFLGKSKKIKIIDECANIKSFHIHFCNARSVKDGEIKY